MVQFVVQQLRTASPGMAKRKSVSHEAVRDQVRGSQHSKSSTVGRPKVHDGDKVCPGCNASFAPNSFRKHFAASHHRKDKSLECIVPEGKSETAKFGRKLCPTHDAGAKALISCC